MGTEGQVFQFGLPAAKAEVRALGNTESQDRRGIAIGMGIRIGAVKHASCERGSRLHDQLDRSPGPSDGLHIGPRC